MADNEGTEQSGAEATEGFHVNLSDNADATVFVDSEEEADTPEATTEPEADGDTEQSADAAEEKPTPPTAEELGYDLKNPKDKAAFDAMLRKWTKWANRHDAKQKQQAKQEPPAPEPEQAGEAPTEPGDDPIAEVYKLDYSGFQPKFREGSDLADYADEFKELFGQFGDYALQGVYKNDKVLRQRMQQQEKVTSAQNTLRGYAAELQAHPEFSIEKIAKFGTPAWEAVAVNDPQGWIDAVSAATGIQPGWRAEQADDDSQRAQSNQRLANKPRAVVQRPTQTGRPALVSQPNGNMNFEQGFGAAWNQHRR